MTTVVTTQLLVILCVLTCNCHLSPSNYVVSKGLSFRIHVVIVSCLREMIIIIHLFRNALIVCETDGKTYRVLGRLRYQISFVRLRVCSGAPLRSLSLCYQGSNTEG